MVSYNKWHITHHEETEIERPSLFQPQYHRCCVCGEALLGFNTTVHESIKDQTKRDEPSEHIGKEPCQISLFMVRTQRNHYRLESQRGDSRLYRK